MEARSGSVTHGSPASGRFILLGATHFLKPVLSWSKGAMHLGPRLPAYEERCMALGVRKDALGLSFLVLNNHPEEPCT